MGEQKRKIMPVRSITKKPFNMGLAIGMADSMGDECGAEVGSELTDFFCNDGIGSCAVRHQYAGVIDGAAGAATANVLKRLSQKDHCLKTSKLLIKLYICHTAVACDQSGALHANIFVCQFHEV